MVEFQEIVSNQPQFKAKAYIEYNIGQKSRIVCEEPTCAFFEDRSCLNKAAVIEDDCPSDTWCTSYTAKS